MYRETNTHGQPKPKPKKENAHTTLGLGFWSFCATSKALQLPHQQKMAKQQRKTFENSAKKWKKIKWQPRGVEKSGGGRGGTSAQYKLTRVFHLNVFAALQLESPFLAAFNNSTAQRLQLQSLPLKPEINFGPRKYAANMANRAT